MNKPTEDFLETYAEWQENQREFKAKHGHVFSIEDGSKIEFLFLRWDEHWEFDFPCICAAPVFRYSTVGIDPEAWLEDLLIDLVIEGCILDETADFESERAWRRWPTPKRLKQIIRERLRGKTTWGSFDAIARRFVVEFKWNAAEGEMQTNIVEDEEA